MKEESSTYWNRLIKLRDNSSDEEIRRRADSLLGQMNTAGGRMIHGEVGNFLRENEK